MKLRAVCGIVSSTGQKPSVEEQVGWQRQMGVLHSEHKTSPNNLSWAVPEASPACASQAQVESAPWGRLVCPKELAAVGIGKMVLG